MKKILLIFVLAAVVSSANLFSWDPSYLATYPQCTKGGDWQLNFGIGFPYAEEHFRVLVPPIRFTFDKNTPLGDKKLPFFFGGLVTYSANTWKDHNSKRHMISYINTAVRIGYHFNWDVDRLDTYVVSKFGAGFRIDNSSLGGDKVWPVVGTNIGARWYVSEKFGFWAEGGLGFHNLTPNANIGFAFKL